jgi:hypothetical protein
MQLDGLTLFGLLSVSAMLLFYGGPQSLVCLGLRWRLPGRLRYGSLQGA